MRIKEITLIYANIGCAIPRNKEFMTTVEILNNSILAYQLFTSREDEILDQVNRRNVISETIGSMMHKGKNKLHDQLSSVKKMKESKR